MKTYTLLGADGEPYQSPEKGLLGGHARTRVYGRMDCPVALSLLRRGFQPRHRVFFKDESVAIAAGYRPCGACLREKYRAVEAHGSVCAPHHHVARADRDRRPPPPRGRVRRRGRGLRHRRRRSVRAPARSAPPATPAATAQPRGSTPARRPRRRRRRTPSTRCRCSSRSAGSSCCASTAPTAPSYVRKVLHNGWASGAILFGDNVASPEQLRALTAALRRSGRAGGATPIVCTDQEGGAIRNVRWAPPAPPGRGAGARARCRRPPRSPCARPGSTSRLAPVADVPSVDGAAMAGREFSRDPQRVATATKAAIGGWLAGGVKPTVKHFPGLGGATVNTDQGSATIAGGAPTDADLAPFKAAIAAKVPIVMSAHAVYPRLDRAPHRVAVAGGAQGPPARSTRALRAS